MVRILVFVLIIPAILSCAKEPEPQNLHEEINRIINPYIYSGSRVGVAVGIYNNGVEEMFFYGTKNIETGETIDENTMFEIGSITKTFTSVMLAEMEIEGKINRNNEVHTFFPTTVTIPTYNDTAMRLVHLSNHTSALPYMPDNFDTKQLPPPFDTYTEAELYTFLVNLQLSRQPGTKYEYSNIGVGLLGYILAKCDSSAYFDMVKNRILNPLGMNSTVTDFSAVSGNNIATGYIGNQVQEQWLFSEVFIGAGALKSNLADMMKYLKAFLETSDDTLQCAMQETCKLTFSGEYDMGLAWFISKLDDGQTVIWHNGGTGGYSSVMAFNPETGKGLIILTNSQSGQENEVFMAQELMLALQKY
jgi:D-alanyl-D-alanine-carboxypeptidase/D-alanyl-D-alanine-endopeptidase